jgi:hypothetical protein
MSTPAEQHPIDPLSQALGRIEGRLEGLDKRLGTLERQLLWLIGIVVTGLLAQVGTLVAIVLRGSLVALLLLGLPALAAAQTSVLPQGGAAAPGTLRNPYVVYDRGFPVGQFNTPQMGTVPPSQPLLTTPLGRPLGSDWGAPSGGRGVLGGD